MRTAAPLVILAVALTACASSNRSSNRQADGDLTHNPETCTIDGHNHAGEVLAGAQAAAEDAARDAAWHARERERNERTEPSKPRTAEPAQPKDDGKEEKPNAPAPRIPPPR